MNNKVSAPQKQSNPVRSSALLAETRSASCEGRSDPAQQQDRPALSLCCIFGTASRLLTDALRGHDAAAASPATAASNYRGIIDSLRHHATQLSLAVSDPDACRGVRLERAIEALFTAAFIAGDADLSRKLDAIALRLHRKLLDDACCASRQPAGSDRPSPPGAPLSSRENVAPAAATVEDPVVRQP